MLSRDSGLRARLQHVYWIGGSPCCGKSSIARMLAERHGLRLYTCDDEFLRHAKSADPRLHPHLHTVLRRVTQADWDGVFMRPVEEQVADELAVFREEFPMILDDLLEVSAETPVLVEGTALLPECVAEVGTSPSHQIWIVPTEEFQRDHYSSRGTWVQDILRQCSEPELAFENWMARDASFARTVARDAASRGLRTIVVDGRLSLLEIAALVEAHLDQRESEL